MFVWIPSKEPSEFCQDTLTENSNHELILPRKYIWIPQRRDEALFTRFFPQAHMSGAVRHENGSFLFTRWDSVCPATLREVLARHLKCSEVSIKKHN